MRAAPEGSAMPLIRGVCRRLLRHFRREDGITGLETAIILIAFVVVAAVFAFVVLSTGLFSSERSKESVYAGLAKTRATMNLASGVVGRANGGLTQVDSIEFDLVLAAAGEQVNLDPTATTNRTVITYIDATTVVNDVAYTTTVITGNPNAMLEQGELIRVTVNLAAIGATVGPNGTFTLEIKPPTGSYLNVQRSTPPALLAVMQLN
jgi:flagellin FlaB